MRDERGDETEKREEMKLCAEHPETYSWLNYKSGREMIDVEGAPVPEGMLTRLLKCLKEHRWSAFSHRPSMESQHYLVLKRNSKESGSVAGNSGDDDLRACCEEIIVNFAERFRVRFVGNYEKLRRVSSRRQRRHELSVCFVIG